MKENDEDGDHALSRRGSDPPSPGLEAGGPGSPREPDSPRLRRPAPDGRSASFGRERPGHTLQPTAIVNEVYLRLVGGEEEDWQNRAHFFAAAARSMRRILVDHARARNAKKRGGQGARYLLDTTVMVEPRAGRPDRRRRRAGEAGGARLGAGPRRRAAFLRGPDRGRDRGSSRAVSRPPFTASGFPPRPTCTGSSPAPPHDSGPLAEGPGSARRGPELDGGVARRLSRPGVPGLIRSCGRKSSRSSPRSRAAPRASGVTGDRRRVGDRHRARSLRRSPAGMRLGPYEILALLGAGGMGEVYRARDTRLNREVAIKVLPQSLAGNRPALARFKREAQAIAALSHPNIRAIHDFGEEGDVLYAVGELLEGQTLQERLMEGAPPAAKGGGVRAGNRPRALRRPREGDRPPRPEARQRLSDSRRRRQDPRLRPRQDRPALSRRPVSSRTAE